MALQSLPSTGQEDPEVVEAMAQDIQKVSQICPLRLPDSYIDKNNSVWKHRAAERHLIRSHPRPTGFH